MFQKQREITKSLEGSMKCRAITKSGDQCKRRAEENGYCSLKSHQAQAVEEVEEEIEEVVEEEVAKVTSMDMLRFLNGNACDLNSLYPNHRYIVKQICADGDAACSKSGIHCLTEQGAKKILGL